jgi:uncharacterized protein involved in outer membrane biogenesis
LSYFGPATSAVPSSASTERVGGAYTVKQIALAILAGIILILIIPIAILLLDASILRQPIAKYISDKLERPFAINGDLRVGLFKHPYVEANGVVLGNAAWATAPEMLRIERVKVSIELTPLFGGRVVLPEVELTKPDVTLERDIDGEGNWSFRSDQGTQSSERTRPPEIRSLWIESGKLTFRDPEVRTEIELALDSDRGGESNIRFTGRGSLRDEEFHLEGRAGSLLELKESGKPYRVDAKASAGDTKVAFAGTVVPVKLETIDGDIDMSGKDLAKLYPLVPVPLPWTSSYRLSGHLTREGEKYTVHGLKGRVGASDLEGDASIDLADTRPHLTADLTSKRLDYKDLLGFLGVPPPSKGKPRPPEQQVQAERLEETGRVLSSKPYSLERLRAADADVKFKGESILARDIPLDNVVVRLKLRNGTLVLAPLDFGVAGGHVVSRLTLDASKDVIQTDVDATASNLEVKALLPKLKENQGSAGKARRALPSTKGNPSHKWPHPRMAKWP